MLGTLLAGLGNFVGEIEYRGRGASRFLFAQGRQQSLWISVVAEGAAQVDEDVPISRAENEAGAWWTAGISHL
jgi:hypothetical protein